MAISKMLWLVSGGDARLARIGIDAPDGVESVFTLATTRDHALATAAFYDRGECGIDNYTLPTGETVGAVESIEEIAR